MDKKSNFIILFEQFYNDERFNEIYNDENKRNNAIMILRNDGLNDLLKSVIITNTNEYISGISLLFFSMLFMENQNVSNLKISDTYKVIDEIYNKINEEININKEMVQ